MLCCVSDLCMLPYDVLCVFVYDMYVCVNTCYVCMSGMLCMYEIVCMYVMYVSVRLCNVCIQCMMCYDTRWLWCATLGYACYVMCVLRCVQKKGCVWMSVLCVCFNVCYCSVCMHVCTYVCTSVM